MNIALEKYLHKEPKEAYWINERGEKYRQSVHGKSYVRYNEAVKQAAHKPIDKKEIIKYTTDYLKEIGIQTTDNPEYNPKNIDYDKIQEQFELEDKGDLVWMKFTGDGYLGVVAVSDDVNFDIPEDCSVYDKKHIVYPSLFSTVITVLNRIFISSPKVQLLIYSVSSLTTSSKSVISLLPLTCHIPVIPGLMAILAL